MANLGAAHKGYLYQDIATAYFLANALVDPVREISVDFKRHPADRFDDLSIVETNATQLRRQFKHTDGETPFAQKFLSSDSTRDHSTPCRERELLTPNRKDLKQVFADQFEGMTLDPVPLAVLEDTRERLIERINADLTAGEREFLLLMKRLEPKWELLGLPGVERLPGPQWKLYNLRKMDAARRRAAEEQLRKRLGL
ncbi:MAG: hypothetical protein HZA32_03150 [Opitutae bacterium]|jgi:hypothetical protein|nr:hypothetical protein [Opitutae bacterium]